MVRAGGRGYIGQGQQEGVEGASSRTTERAIQNVFANSTNAS